MRERRLRLLLPVQETAKDFHMNDCMYFNALDPHFYMVISTVRGDLCSCILFYMYNQTPEPTVLSPFF